MLRRLVLLLVLALLAVACTGNSSEPSTTAGSGTSQPQTTTTVEPGDATTTTVEPTTPATPPDLSGLEGVSDEVRAQLEQLIVEAQEIRGLPFLSLPIITVVTDDELERRVREAISEESEDFPADEALYKLLGLLGQDTDLGATLTDLYGEQVAGFYDGDTGEIVVPARESGFSIIQQATMVHELIHALTDQHFSFNDAYELMFEEDRLDEAAAYQALIEGDATLAEVMWVQGLSQQDLGRFVAESLEIDTGAFDTTPGFLRDSLIFPYDTGLSFTQDLYAVGGWQEINEAYDVFPPLPGSTEQVITPDDYQRDLPLVVEMPSVTLSGYELERTSVWGEQGLRVMLSQAIDDSTTARAADGWGGDGYHQWFDGENAAFLLVYEGDTSGDVDELERALLDFARSSVPEEAFVWVDTDDEQLFFIAADEVPVGERIRSAVGLG